MKSPQKNKEPRKPKIESYEVMHVRPTTYETRLGAATTAICAVLSLIAPLEPNLKDHESVTSAAFYGAGYVAAIATAFNLKPFRS